jgi:hypothetical protein
MYLYYVPIFFQKKLMYFEGITKYVEGISMYINAFQCIVCGSTRMCTSM